ncbi:MAG TPA: hypothetical protein PL009_15015, partial [Flavipsychrobacter sp.]|nr:hypothetical protein [Flavipsychrobacter sp.]
MNKLLFLWICICTVISFDVPAQKLNSLDSARVKAYMDSAWTYTSYSMKRQLYLDKALEIAPQNAYLWQQKGMPLFKQFKYEAGLPFLDSAVKYDADRWLDYRAFMKCIFQKSYRSSLEDFYAVIRMKGDGGLMDHPYAFYMGLCYLQLNELDSAEHYFRRCIDERTRQHGEKWVHQLHWCYLGIVH